MATRGSTASEEPPFSRDMQLNHDPCLPMSDTDQSLCGPPGDSVSRIPGQPSMPLRGDAIFGFLQRELGTPVLDDLYPQLHLVGRKSGKHIDPLHVQAIKGRRIVVTESPGLHIVWFYSVVYVKPIPPCLLNYDIWKTYICHRSNQCPPRVAALRGAIGSSVLPFCSLGAAYGFLRTYAFLIQHHSDFRLAVRTSLLPDDVDWPSFSRFISRFRDISDRDVSRRYRFGQLRLTRLNWAVRLIRPRSANGSWNYHGTSWQTGQYIERFYGPLLFGFGSATMVLSAMQVVASIPGGNAQFSTGWNAFRRTNYGFSMVTIGFHKKPICHPWRDKKLEQADGPHDPEARADIHPTVQVEYGHAAEEATITGAGGDNHACVHGGSCADHPGIKDVKGGTSPGRRESTSPSESRIRLPRRSAAQYWSVARTSARTAFHELTALLQWLSTLAGCHWETFEGWEWGLGLGSGLGSGGRT
ncbi:hypothetical protein FGG08_000445 [Glutinoglossum americanum]|uniref:Uncharacterized protein n=1 Tax=Glutinoglossum americanum TaxID=1670608 RepID=A0A9P8L622_9PEZI|nr:hypothetical protein FGG08_000445 [Glutinoglossum americanum]